jgi:hypothetical protein
VSTSDDVSAIKQIFDRRYAYWEIALPVTDSPEPERGSLIGRGLSINYQFGIGEDGVLYLEYFVGDRITNDSLNRIYADGREELIDENQVGYLADDEQARQAYFQNNQTFYEEVKRRGLL